MNNHCITAGGGNGISIIMDWMNNIMNAHGNTKFKILSMCLQVVRQVDLLFAHTIAASL